ncbi:MAG TPA: VanZ family protein [Anaerolineales bacterium]|nr:VanZ family protein [Anaerolineales bacterium]
MKWLAILFSLLIVIIIVLADMGALPDSLQVWNDLPYGDKAGHFILYGILTLLIDLALFRSFPLQRPKLVAVITGLILAVLIGLEEFSQQFFANRTFSLLDLAAGYLGVIFFSWLAIKTET